jgi:type VI protein secretion system component Hcp
MAVSHLTRRHALRIGVAGAAALAFVPGSLTTARAAFDTYISFEGGAAIAGPRPDKSMEIDSFSWGAANNTLNIGSASSGASAGKITFNPFTITRKTDSASPSLYQACASGKHFSTVKIVQGSRTVVLDDVLISSYQTGGSHDRPTETFVLKYTKYTITDAGQSPMMRMEVAPQPVVTKRPTP